MELADWEIVMLLHLISSLGDGKEYAKQERVYGDGQFYWESREERKNFYRLG